MIVNGKRSSNWYGIHYTRVLAGKNNSVFLFLF